MKSQISAIYMSGPAATLQEPDLGAMTPMMADGANYLSFNKKANKVMATAAASKAHAKDLENSGSTQMANSKPSLLLI
jgi:hypothetical protein